MNVVADMAGHWKLLRVVSMLLFVIRCSAMQVLQETVEWRFHRFLYDYKEYGAITLERINIPLHTVLVNFNSSVESSSSSCSLKYAKIFAGQFGIPVVSRDGETFPVKTFVSQTSLSNVSVPSNNHTVAWEMSDLKAGELILMAFVPQPDERIRQQGLGEECEYFMNTRATIKYYLDKDIDQLVPNSSYVVTLRERVHTLLSFRIPQDAASYTVDVQGCDTEQCPVNVSTWEALFNNMRDENHNDCHWLNGSCRLKVVSPAVNRLSYLSLSADINVNLSILIISQFCDLSYNISNIQPRLIANTSLACILTSDLGREAKSQDEKDANTNFNDHFVTWNKDFQPQLVENVATPDSVAIVTRFSLRSSDTGSSLRVYLHLPAEKNSGHVTITACLSAHRLQQPSHCQTGAVLSVTNQKDANKDFVTVPYPQSGHWFVTMKSRCYHMNPNKSEEVTIPCKSLPVANLTVRLATCIDGGCGDFGTCKLYREADMHFSACYCYGGWRGYGCNDGSKAISSAMELLTVYLLTLSNLGFIPGIWLSIHRKFYVEALVYSFNMFLSTFYHACDVNPRYQLCIMPYNTLSFGDFMASLLSFWVTLMAMARIPQGLRSFMHMLGTMFISVGEVYNRHGLFEQLLPLAVGVLMVIGSWGLECYRRKAIFPSKQRLLKFILPGLSLASLGLILNLAFQTDSNYKYIHSIWHIVVSASIVFLLPPAKFGTHGLSVQSGDITRQPSLESQGIIHSADDPVTEIENLTSSQHPSPPDTPSYRAGDSFKLNSRSNSSHTRSQNLVL